MVHIVVGLFEESKAAGEAVAELKRMGYAKDISLIARDEKTHKIHLYQIKHEDMEIVDTERGAELGALGGIIGGLSVVLNPILAAPAIIAAFAVTMGVAGAAIGAAFGEYMGDLSGAGLLPERAKIYQDKIKNGEVFVSVADSKGADAKVRKIFEQFHGTHIHTLNSEK